MRRLGAHARARSLVANRSGFILLLGLRENCNYNTSKSMNHNTSTTCKRLWSAESLTLAHKARVVEWQTRTFEGRMPKGMRVQVPPRARFLERRLRLAGLREINLNADRTLPRDQLRWCCLRRAQSRCSCRVAGLR